MQINESILTNEERAILGLRSLYTAYGYIPYRMSKFEEYDLYVRNKDFLPSDRIITFNDTNGRLLALKPDVTLSIIRSTEDQKLCKHKVCYNENVYRVSDGTGRFKEIMQTGLECIGDIDMYDILEVTDLAAHTLAEISDNFVLDVSNMEILSAAINNAGTDPEFQAQAYRYIEARNRHDLSRLCRKYGATEKATEVLDSLVATYGRRDEVIARLEDLLGEDAVKDLKELSGLLDNTQYSDRIRFDFSVVNNMNYYNGFVFRGFVNGICSGVLSGGQYGRMMQKLNRKSKAVGFALYLDLLDRMDSNGGKTDVDVLLIYSENTATQDVAAKVADLRAQGLKVSAQKAVPEKLRYREIVRIEEDCRC